MASAHGFEPILRPVEGLIYRLCGVREDEEMTWYAYALSMLAFSLIGLAYLYVLAAHAGMAAAQSRSTSTIWRPTSRGTRPSAFHQHELAVLFRRDGDELSLADGRAGLAQLRFGGGRHRGRGRGHSRLRAHQREDARKLLGRSDARARSTSCCRSRSSAALFFVWQGVPQNFHAYHDVKSLEGFVADDHRRPDGLAGSHQGTRAPTAAASSTRTRPRPTRTRRR